MSNTVFLKFMPYGPAGVLSRPHVHTNEAQVQSAANPVILYGVPVKMVAGFATAIAASDTASVVYGFSVRQFPRMDFTYAVGFGNAVPPAKGTIDIMRRGYMLVQVNAGVPAAQGVVYMRVATPAAGKPIGGIEAVADSTNTVVIAGAQFMGPADENGVAEISYNI